jgi:Tol biopolymer transport system component
LLTSAGIYPTLSPDGRRLVFSGQGGIFSVSVMTLEDIRPSELVCQNCGRPYGFSSSGSKLVYRSRTGIDVLDFATGSKTHVIDTLATLYSGARISPDDRWIAFNEVTPGISQIRIAPFGSSAAPPSEWIPVTDANTWNYQPRWSPSGNLLYYTSDRDGFRCIWAQRLDDHKRAAGPPFAVHHSHSARSCLLNVEPVYAGLEVARGKLIFVNGELTGDVWMLRLH